MLGTVPQFPMPGTLWPQDTLRFQLLAVRPSSRVSKLRVFLFPVITEPEVCCVDTWTGPSTH